MGLSKGGMSFVSHGVLSYEEVHGREIAKRGMVGSILVR